MLKNESDARAKAEERLRRVMEARAGIEQKAQVQVEQKLHTQQLRFGGLIEKTEAQVNEEIAKAKVQLEELLERVNAYKEEAEEKRLKLNDAQEQLKAETTAKIKAYEKLRIEKRQRIKAQAKLRGDITEVEAKAIARPVGIKRYTRTGILHAEVINAYDTDYLPFAHPRHTKRKIAVLSALVILSTIIFVIIVGKYPFTGESDLELTGKPVLVTASIGSEANVEKPTDNKPAVSLSGNKSSSEVSTSSTAALKTDSEDKAEIKINEEKSIAEQKNPPTIEEEHSMPKIITSVNSHIVQSSDNNRWEMQIGSYVSYAFSEVFIPADAVIKSVVIFIEHFEEARFIEGRLEWSIGTGWPNKPEVWAAIKAPIHRGESNENVDMWDVTSAVDSVEKLKALQLHVKNNSYSYKSKTLMDYAYVVVEYD